MTSKSSKLALKLSISSKRVFYELIYSARFIIIPKVKIATPFIPNLDFLSLDHVILIKTNMPWSNYHSHTYYCDGKLSPKAYIKEAIEIDVISYGFSSHIPVPFENLWSMKKEKLQSYFDEIEDVKKQFGNELQIYTSLEVDYIPNVIGPAFPEVQKLPLDYTIGSVHYIDQFEDGTPWEIDGQTAVFEKGLSEIFKGKIKSTIQRYYELTRQMIAEGNVDIVGHLDKIKMHNEKKPFFSEDSGWYQSEMSKTLEVIADSGAILEVNTRGVYKKQASTTYPSPEFLRRAKAMNIPITLNSDCHTPLEMTGYFPQACRMLKDIGFTHLMVLLDGNWEKVPFKPNGLQL